MKVKILFWDIETKPNLGYCWGKYEQNIIAFKDEGGLLSYAWKWQGEKNAHCKTLKDFGGNEKKLLEHLHNNLSQADIIIGHNQDSFDVKKSRGRFVVHGLKPLKHLVSIDTKKVAKKYFFFNSNSLNDLGKILKLGQKVSTGGFQLWLDCMANKSKAWVKMAKYNKQDVQLLEQVYNRLKPYITNHPSISLLKGSKDGCPSCGSMKLQKRGLRATHKSISQQYQCNKCHAWHLKPISKKELDKRNKK